MSPNRLEHLLSLVGPFITKKSCRSREVISAEERLVLTLRYLATGDSQQSHSFNFLIGRTTVCHIIIDTCDGIWQALRATYLKPPKNMDEWKSIAGEFENEWNFPHCLGALDGKHVAMDCPKNGGSSYFNYKGFHSLVLMAICDANYCFTFVDIGGFGSDNDASIFSESKISKAFSSNQLCIPGSQCIDGFNLPYVLVCDEIFGLKPWLMKPYPGKKLPVEKEVFNYRLSRCRRTIENTFGILAAKWRIFRRPIRADPETVEKIVQATVCLHNYLKLTDNATYIPKGFIDCEDSTGNITLGDWRTVVSNDTSAIRNAAKVGSNNYSMDAKDVREEYTRYFNSPVGSVPWQYKHVTSCGEKVP